MAKMSKKRKENCQKYLKIAKTVEKPGKTIKNI